jgi:hypothetical protein
LESVVGGETARSGACGNILSAVVDGLPSLEAAEDVRRACSRAERRS